MMTHRLGPATTMVDAELPLEPVAEHLVSMSALREHYWTIEEVEHLIDERPGDTPRSSSWTEASS
ncbi:hypothetical protein BH09GEM1_BH09GEM1_45740 [soil metagenome]